MQTTSLSRALDPQVAVDAARLGTFYCDWPPASIVWNDTCKAHFFLPPDAEVDFPLFYSLLHPDDREPTRQAIARALAEREEYDVEYRTVASDGRTRWINAVGRFHYGEGGEPVRFDGITLDISARKRAKAALEAGAERLSLILDNVKNIVFLLAVEADGGYSFLFVNPAFLAATGLREEQVVGCRVLNVIPTAAHDLVLGKYAEAIRESRAVEWEETSNYPSGERVGEVRVVPILDGQGRCTQLLGTVHDITAQRHAQERADQLLSLSAGLSGTLTTAQVCEVIMGAALPIFQATMGLVARLSEDGNTLESECIVGVPDAEADLWRSFPAAASLPLADAVRERRLVVLLNDADHDAAYPELISARAAAGRGALVAVPLLVGERCVGGLGLICPPERCQDEEHRAFLWTLAGQCALSLERARLFDALRLSEARYRTLVDATAQIVWTNTPDGRMSGTNTAWGAFTGQSEAEYQGYGWAGAVHPDDAQPTIEAWQEAVAARAVFTFEHRLRRHDGVYRTFSIRGVPVLREDGAIREWVGVHTDVTERRAMEAAQAAAARQQRQFLRDVLASVTEGELRLCDTLEDLPPPLVPFGPPVALSTSGGLRELRRAAAEAAQRLGVSQERTDDLVTAVSEVGMNAVVHVGEGVGQVFVSESGDRVQVRVTDRGPGIALENLPHATLKKGYSSAGTLGYGMTMMLQTTDHVFLATGVNGTTAVLEKDRIAPIEHPAA